MARRSLKRDLAVAQMRLESAARDVVKAGRRDTPMTLAFALSRLRDALAGLDRLLPAPSLSDAPEGGGHTNNSKETSR